MSRVCRKWRSLTIRILSSSSRRSVPIIRSQIAFARGAAGGLWTGEDPDAVCGEDRIECPGEPESRSRSRNFTVVTRSPRSISRLRAA
jgi:hypothetical protein